MPAGEGGVRPWLNLASRPFRNQRLPNSLAALLWVVLLLATTQHARVLAELAPGGTSKAHRALAEAEQELARLRDQRAKLDLPEPGREERERWKALQELVDRRTLSWTRLLAVLEGVLPPDVRLTTIVPQPSGDGFEVSVSAVARDDEAALEFLKQLQAHPEIDDVLPDGMAEVANGTQLRATMSYRPAPGAAPASSSTPDPGEEEDQNEPDEEEGP
jgi:Tfp pilus assembly protein PilN